MSIEELLKQPYCVVDILPRQVPADGGGQYFKVEQYYLRDMGRLSCIYADILLKMNCYYDLALSLDADHWQVNPEPEKIAQVVMACLKGELTETCLFVTLAEGTMLLTLQRDTTYMTFYNPADETLQLLRQLALAEGLFVWKPFDDDDKR